jgi:hypothetical protein
VTAYDWSYRRLHGLDRPEAQAGPVLRIERRRLWRALRLGDGTQLDRGSPIGVVHLDNARVLALHRDGLAPDSIGFEFRRLLLRSLHAMARQAAEDGPRAALQAYSATTLFHPGLARLGFAQARDDRSLWRGLVSGYERWLLRCLHPAGGGARRRAREEARRLWISRERLLALYGRALAAEHARQLRPGQGEIWIASGREGQGAHRRP